MRQPQYTLRRDQVQDRVQHLLQRHLRLADFGRTCPATALIRLLGAAAAWLISLSAACQRLRQAPSRETARRALSHTLPTLDELRRRLDDALCDDLPAALRRRPQWLAADLTLVPYHGRTRPGEEATVCRGLARSGTSHFHSYATLFTLYRGRRFSVAVTLVQRDQSLAAVLRLLLAEARRHGVRPQRLLLDRGFFNVAVVRYLQAARCPFVVLMPCRGRRPDKPGGPGGTQRHCYRRRSRWDEHTWTDENGRRATVQVCVRVGRRRAARRPGRRARPKGTSRPFAFWGWQPGSYRQVEQAYRRRFAIETSYRQLRQARVRTASRDAALRLLYVGVALLLRNVWVWLHDRYLAERRRGGRVVHLERLRFQMLLWWLARSAEATFGACDTTTAAVPS
jgi:putative transposase